MKLTVSLNGAIELDAGTVEETTDSWIVQPPDQPMIEQLVSYLEAYPEDIGGFQIRHLSVGLVALCIRWGTYLATVMDPTVDAHPDLPALNTTMPGNCCSIMNAEMRRLNLEVSANIAWLVSYWRDHDTFALERMLRKAYCALPMPFKDVKREAEVVSYLIAHLMQGKETMTKHPDPKRTIPRNQADRFLANALTYHWWRNGSGIEMYHGSQSFAHPLQPHQIRY